MAAGTSLVWTRAPRPLKARPEILLRPAGSRQAQPDDVACGIGSQAGVLVARAGRREGRVLVPAGARGGGRRDGLGDRPAPVGAPAGGRAPRLARRARPAAVGALDHAAAGAGLARRPAPDERAEALVAGLELIEADEVDAAARHRRRGGRRDPVVERGLA